MRKLFLHLFFAAGLFLPSIFVVTGQPLAGTDDLGRTLLQNDAVGNPKSDRYVAMFYFICQGDTVIPLAGDHWDLTELYKNTPKVFEDYDDPDWGGPGICYYWGQPIYGYYRADDYWVHLRNMQLLADAGVDFLVMDVTNRFVFPEQHESLMKAMDAVRAQGKKPPKIVFYTNTQSAETIQDIYNLYYKEGAPYQHPDCWFYMEGKPLIIGVTAEIKDQDFRDFFTYRESQWPLESQKANGWPWISFYREPRVHYNSRGEKEIINVSVAQHPNPAAGMGGSAFYGIKDNWGRSYRNGKHGNPETDIFYGYNIQEQWEVALKQDVPFVFVTGWNEWVVLRNPDWCINPKHSWFCDAASAEFSRDIEPSLTGDLKDHYYMQLVNNIRRYKGVEKNPSPGAMKTIGKISDWADVSLTYTDYTGDTQDRNHPGSQTKPVTVYTNTTGRNDFHVMKVARDQGNIFFYAETVDDITPVSGDNWMRLYIDSDRNPNTGWKGYDYRVVKGNMLQQYVDGAWKNVQTVKYATEKNKMTVTIPKSYLENLLTPISIEFKWSDNMQKEDPLDWYVNGDTAPGGRFNYIFEE